MKKARFAAQKGAVSVLVVITMLMLILFGLLTLYSARAYERLGQKAVTWTQEFYELDGLAEAHIQLLDGCLIRAEKRSREYVSAKMYTQPGASLGTMPQAYIYETFLSAGDESAFAQKLFCRLYAFYALEELDALMAENDFFTCTLNSAKYASNGALLNHLDDASKDFEDTDLYLAFGVTEGEEVQYKNLSVGLYVLPAATRVAVTGSAVTGETRESARYRIAIWQEWQNEAPSEGQEFWSGTFDDFTLNPDVEPLDDSLIDDTLPAD